MTSQCTTQMIDHVRRSRMTESHYNVLMAMSDTGRNEGINERNMYSNTKNPHPSPARLSQKMRNPKTNIIVKKFNTIEHTKEQEAQIALKRLKKNKKKQAKKNKKNKKKTKKKTSKEHIDELNAEFQTEMDEHAKEIYRKLEIYKQQKLRDAEFQTAMDEHMKEICRKAEWCRF